MTSSELCANLTCTDPIHRTDNGQFHACWKCRGHILFDAFPVHGFIAGPTLTHIGRALAAHIKPTAGETKEALQIMRGPRYRSGDWNQRPTLSVTLLLAKSRPLMSRRIPHIQVGRRKAPSLNNICSAVAHFILAQRLIMPNAKATQYPFMLAGQTFYQRRAVSKPTGTITMMMTANGHRQVRGTYYLGFRDYGHLGRLAVTNAFPMLTGGLLKATDPGIVSLVTDMYLKGISDGSLRGRVIVHKGSHQGAFGGDHPHDDYVPDTLPKASQYCHGLRRAGGTIGGEWPDGLDFTRDDLTAHKQGKLVPYDPTDIGNRQRQPTTPAAPPTPDTSWIFK